MPVYAIAMDVGKLGHRAQLVGHRLLRLLSCRGDPAFDRARAETTPLIFRRGRIEGAPHKPAFLMAQHRAQVLRGLAD